MFTPSKRLQSLAGYAFAEVQNAVNALKDQGITPIDFGVGDPIDPTPDFIREAMKKGADDFASAGYPSYVGRQDFRKSVAEYSRLRFGVELDPETEITSTVGSKEGVFNFPEAILDPGDVVLIPSPGYPPYKRGTLFAEGSSYFYPLLAENNFFPDFDSFPAEVLEKAKILWLCYPNNPTGALATREFYEKAIAFAKEHDIIIASDECYTDIYLTDEAPLSILELAKENIITFHSLSKRSNMTGYRIGWVAGDPEIVAAFKKLKTNIDSGTPDFIQSAAIAALGNNDHVVTQRSLYRERAQVLTQAFKEIGLEPAVPQGAFYLWQRVPQGMTSVEFAQKLLSPEIAMVVTPGAWISDECTQPNGDVINPGEGYVRFALVPSLAQTKEAAEKLVANFGNA
jgi:LL-diaminopimelate aminotransferase